MKEYTVKAFTLIELLVVIVIISIISFIISLKFYLPYKERAYLAADTLNKGSACLSDILSFCSLHSGANFNPYNFKNCQNSTGLYGQITVIAPAGRCTEDGTPPDGYEITLLSSVSDLFETKCCYKNNGIRCYIEPR